ncbi:CgeB family protein [Oleisolibacter albus]|uniref:CgeB family protein n=1 Tax=Oleisolibacter albus TaxID=2171757 RepID=UPI000DF40D36|nr:glycosyltransferase [Oleisolibacter albus]
MTAPLDITVLGLSITSSWGNGHATTYRGLLREMAARGHRITFLERDVPWYAGAHRDCPAPLGVDTILYGSLEELYDRHAERVRRADAVIVGSYVPDGVAVGDWVQATARGLTAFYDIDTPVTLAGLAGGGTAYLAARQIPGYGLYLSFTGGPTLTRLERAFGSPMARPLHCSADPASHRPQPAAERWALGYLGTYSNDRQPVLDRLLLGAAQALPEQRFVVAGPQYPADIAWPANVERIEHLPPPAHPGFYSAQRFTLNVTRADMVRAGWSPSVRLFEAAACGAPIISDAWDGLDSLFRPGREIIIARDTAAVLDALTRLSEAEVQALGKRARTRVLAAHTAAHRAGELEAHLRTALRLRGAGVIPVPRAAAAGARA